MTYSPTRRRTGYRAQQGGRVTQAYLLTCIARHVRLLRLPDCGGSYKRNRVSGSPELRHQKMPCDFAGTVRSGPLRGTAFYADAKRCAIKTGFDVHNRSTVKPHQREELELQGDAGAIAGLIVEATHPEVAGVYWIDWRLLKERSRLAWSDPRVIRLGSNDKYVDLMPVLERHRGGVA